MNIDMNILLGIKNFLQLINDNWTIIIVIVGLAIAIVKKIKNFFSKSDDEKIAITKDQIREIMLKLVTDAEMDYLEWSKAGGVKRSQVIEQIFSMYPILSEVVDQESLIKWIDAVIDEALNTMREIFEENKECEIESCSKVEQTTDIVTSTVSDNASGMQTQITQTVNGICLKVDNDDSEN